MRLGCFNCENSLEASGEARIAYDIADDLRRSEMGKFDDF